MVQQCEKRRRKQVFNSRLIRKNWGGRLVNLRHFQRRLAQLWRWRKNRKSFKIWRVLRLYALGKSWRFTQIHRFQTKWMLKKYRQWRSGIEFDVNSWSTSIFKQNKEQSVGRWNQLTLQNMGVFWGIGKNRTALQKKFLGRGVTFNGKFFMDQNLKEVECISVRNQAHGLLRKISVIEGNPLAFSFCFLRRHKSFMFKYNPRLQRHLDYSKQVIVI